MKKANFTYFILVVLFFIQANGNAQDSFSFRVLANKGANTIKNLNHPEAQIIKTGVKISGSDTIVLAEGGYVGLVHSSGKTMELKNQGVYPVKDLIGKINSASTSLAGKYAEFVFNQMTKDGKEDVNKNSRINNKVTGSVERGSEPIHVIAPNSTYIHGPIAILKWNAPQSTSEFVVTVKNLFENNLLTEQTVEKNIIIDINDPKFKNEKLLIVNVKSKKDSKVGSNEIGIKKLPEEELKNIDKDFAVLQAETSEETPLNKIILATFYEQHDLLLDAITQYEAALKLAPDVSDFRSAYELFLVRNNLN